VTLSGPTTIARPWPDEEETADRAILRTVTYAALFQFPLTLAELERRLMDVALPLAEIRRRLNAPFLKRRVELRDGLVYPRGREAWIGERQARGERARGLVEAHRRALSVIARFPFVRLLALSGGCAHGNATDDDVDVFLVVKRGRAWFVFGALMLLSKAAGLRRTLCLNYVLDEDALRLPEQDVFTAAEIVGLKPLQGSEAYVRFLRANEWVAERFPNFGKDIGAAREESLAGAWRPLETLLELGPARILERLARRVLGAYLRRKAGHGTGVVLEPGRLKLHMRDHRPELLEAYEKAVLEAER
jgi:hypothetical protein